jgi:hypothetical protein
MLHQIAGVVGTVVVGKLVEGGVAQSGADCWCTAACPESWLQARHVFSPGMNDER